MKDEFIIINNTVINKTSFLRKLNELEKEIKSLKALSELTLSITEIEKQKLEFAIKQLRGCKKGAFDTVENKIQELQQQLNQL